MVFDLDFAAGVIDATVIRPVSNVAIQNVAIDSRRCTEGSLFVCLPGEKTDGHDFAAVAVKQGASAVLAKRNPFDGEPPVPVLLVEDPAAALRALAAERRDVFGRANGKVIGLTGTAGKTTTKEILAAVLARKGTTSRTEGNLNNDLGVPLSLLNADISAKWWVIEVGISHPGDMDELGSLLRPDLALILNVGPGHAEGLGDKGTAFYKSALLKYLRPGGTALVSADYSDLAREARAIRPDAIFFSCSGQPVAYRATYAGLSPSGNGRYRLWLSGKAVEADTPFHGAFAAENVIAVAAVAHLLGMAPAEITEGLGEAIMPAQRFAMTKAGGWLVVDDSYNANPLSMTRMLNAVTETADNKPLVCVLGAMGELGAISASEHEKLGRHLAGLRPAAIFWVGPHYEDITTGLFDKNYAGQIRTLSEPAELTNALAELHIKEGVLLFKGSRFNRLERFVATFLDQTRTSDAL